MPNGPALAGIALIAGSGIAIVVLNQRRGRKTIALSGGYDHTYDELRECAELD